MLPLLADEGVRQAVVDPTRLDEWQTRADRLLAAEGSGHLVHDLPVRVDGRLPSIASRPWRLDPIPVVLEAATFSWLATALSERMRAIGAVIGDLYGPRKLVEHGIVDAAQLSASSRYRLGAIGHQPLRWLTSYAADVVLGADGTWYLSNELTDAPSGIGYALLDRSVIGRVMPEVLADADVAPVSRAPDLLRTALGSASAVGSPRIVLFTGGIDHPTYVDHSYLAMELGVHLVEGADLVVRNRQVWLRTLTGLEPVDVIYRRLEDPYIDPLEVDALGGDGVPGLLQAVRAGGVALANAHGSGIAESVALRPVLDAAIDAVAPLQQVLPRWPGPSMPLATMPTWTGRELAERAVAVRLYAIDDGDRVSVLPGGNGRVLNPDDDITQPTSALVKDVWVLGRTAVPIVGARLPQVDLRSSLPTRAADALYWMSRAAERAETVARLARVVHSRVDADPDLAGLADGAFAGSVSSLAAAVGRFQTPIRPADGADGQRVIDEVLRALSNTLVHEIGIVLAEAVTVREYLSTTTGRVLVQLADLRAIAQSGALGVEDLDSVLTAFAAFAGLWNESTVRGPAWQIGDIGRRVERSTVVLETLGAVFAPDGRGDGRAPEPGVQKASADATIERESEVVMADPTLGPDAGASVIEVVLATHESLVAYRRRYRSDVEVGPAVELLVHDRHNPRSLSGALAMIHKSARASEWQAGLALADRAQAALQRPYRELVPDIAIVMSEANAAIVSRWFSAPVAPVPMRTTVGNG